MRPTATGGSASCPPRHRSARRRLLPDGRTLPSPIGGILTLPESGRDKLNLDSMRPSLNRIELASGRLLDEGRLPDRLHRLSIRHLAQAEGGLMAAGLQWEGEPGDLVPLVAIDRGGGLATLDAPPDALATMAAYIGSVAFDRSGAILGASCPRGNRIAFWRVADGGFLRTVEIADACALGPSTTPGRFLTASGTGAVVEIDAVSGARHALGRARAGGL